MGSAHTRWRGLLLAWGCLALQVGCATEASTAPTSAQVTAGDEREPRTERPTLDQLRAEVASLERQLEGGPPEQRLPALHRLSAAYEALNEGLRLASGELDQARHDACVERADAAQCSEVESRQGALATELGDARARLVELYRTLTSEHPGDSERETTLYSLALALDGLGSRADALDVYRGLVVEFPEGEHAPLAHVALADALSDDGQMEEALVAYRMALAAGPASPVYGYAQYKLGWAHLNLGQDPQALEAFLAVLRLAEERADDTTRMLARSARADLIAPYARVGTAQAARELFLSHSEDELQGYHWLARLAEAYFDMGQWSDAALIYGQLLEGRPTDDDRCEWHRRRVVAERARAPSNQTSVAAYGVPATAPSPAAPAGCPP